MDHVDAVRLEEVLAADFADDRRRRLPFWTDPTPVPVPEVASSGWVSVASSSSLPIVAAMLWR
ncbi:hypothetical protein ACIOHS_48480 [Streptomyces sp. NPDC088253]|uniref:hypothetical protein n=1 Tax=Streptomyces sp. NPDC088253 TaxID=3365846 RepID=UPI00381B5E61